MLHTLDLSGTWAFALDPMGSGLTEEWFRGPLADTIPLPGSVDEAAKTPLTTQSTMAHLSRRRPYVGKAWYQRSIEMDAEQAGLFHWLLLERPHGEVNLYVDGIKTGRDESLSTPNRFFLGKLTEGRHVLTLLIDNGRFEAVGNAHIAGGNPDVAHSTSDHTQTNWNGIVGRLELQSQLGGLTRVTVYAPSRQIRVELELEAYDTNHLWPSFWKSDAQDKVRVTAWLAGVDQPVVVEADIGITSSLIRHTVEIDLPESARLWDEFDPAVHSLEVEWLRDGQAIDRATTSFGIRDIRRDGRHLLLNGRRIFLRGTLDCCIFPLTGYPPTDHSGWRKVFETAKSYGLNHIRFHSYCPPRAAFEVADELGLLLHIETPIWAILGADPALGRYIHSEAERIVDEYGNHPSFVMLTVGNEVYGARMHAFLERFVESWKARDDRRVYSGGSGWPTIARADYASKPDPRSHRWGEGLKSRLNARPLETRTDWSEWVAKVPMPLVSHEIGQWCVYPDLDEIGKYTGVLEARNFITVRDDLARRNLLPHARDLMINSGKLQTKLYKEDIEAALRTPDFAGFQLLGLQDFSGQGTALVGVVDAFWDEKPYVTPDQFREFCAPTVPLLRADGFVVRRGTKFSADAQIAHFGPATLARASLAVALLDTAGEIVWSTRLEHADLPTGALHHIGAVAVETAHLADGLYELELRGPGFADRYELAVLSAAPPMELECVERLDMSILERIARGASVVLAPSPGQMKPNAELGHTTIFWNTLWTKGQPPHTLGLVNDLTHPLFETFPARSESAWHQWELTYERRAFDVSGLPVRSIIRVIDDWNANRDLTLLAEVRVGNGRLVLCASDIVSDLPTRIVAGKLRASIGAMLADKAADDIPSQSVESVLSWWEIIRT
ncbi:MAG: hypothetical protein ABIQ30_02820 [Devosia sp.]